MKKWHSFPDAVYVINYSARDYRQDGLVSLLVDASTFIAVEDFARQTLPDGWEITDIEKTYAYAEMYAGDDGKWIDIKINEAKNAKDPVEFLHLNDPFTNEATFNLKSLKARQAFARLVAEEFSGVLLNKIPS